MAFNWDDLERDEKVYIVFHGTPMVESELNYAERTAEEMCTEAGETATIMLIPRASLLHALKAVNHGVMLHALGDDD